MVKLSAEIQTNVSSDFGRIRISDIQYSDTYCMRYFHSLFSNNLEVVILCHAISLFNHTTQILMLELNSFNTCSGANPIKLFTP